MFTLAAMLAESRMSDLRAEAEANRLASQARGDRGESRFASAVASVRSILRSPADAPMALPQLSDYPYRG